MQEIKARIISQEKNLYRIKTELGEKSAEVSGKYRHQALTASDYPAVGDEVLVSWPVDGSNAVILSLFPRRSCFMRRAAGGTKREQVVAANVDYVFVCMSLNHDFNLRRLERYLAIAWESGATPVVVLTKADLCPDKADKLREVEGVAIGAAVMAVSSYMEDFAQVYDYVLPGKTVAFLGSSGVGKSTLINKLLGENKLTTQGLRKDDRGRHTTTHRQLLELENGAFLMDTPGMRELGMWDSDGGIDTVFADIEELTTRCRFGDCTHSREPGCAILSALRDGSLTQERWDSYCKLKKENAAAGGGKYSTARQEKFKEIARQRKTLRKNRG